MKWTLFIITLVLISYPIIVIILLEDKITIQRRVALFCEHEWMWAGGKFDVTILVWVESILILG